MSGKIVSSIQQKMEKAFLTYSAASGLLKMRAADDLICLMVGLLREHSDDISKSGGKHGE